MIRWVDATVQHGGRTVLDRASLTVTSGERVAIVGRNGAGKTTLLRVGVALQRPSAGRAEVASGDVATLTPRARAAAVAWLPQQRRASDAVSVTSAVAAARYRFDEVTAVRARAVLDALDRAGVAHVAGRRTDTLSGGEAQRVALAGLVAQDAGVWLLDEPANHLDPAVQRDTFSFLAREADAGRTLVVVTHDLELLGWLAAPDAPERVRVVGLDAGRVAVDATLADPALPAALTDLLGVRVHTTRVDGRVQLLLGATVTP